MGRITPSSFGRLNIQLGAPPMAHAQPMCHGAPQAFTSIRIIHAYNLQGYIQKTYGAMVVSEGVGDQEGVR